MPPGGWAAWAEARPPATLASLLASPSSGARAARCRRPASLSPLMRRPMGVPCWELRRGVPRGVPCGVSRGVPRDDAPVVVAATAAAVVRLRRNAGSRKGDAGRDPAALSDGGAAGTLMGGGEV
jgi:hypothetical protein